MSELALKLIAENKKTKAKFLDLGNCGLTDLPDELFELTWLERLNLGDSYPEADFNKLKRSYNSQIGNRFNENSGNVKKLVDLGNLSSLYLRNSSISEISALSELKHLTSLDLSGNQIKDILKLDNLRSLTSLYLNFNEITDISILGILKSLTCLELSYTSTTEISILGDLTSLTRLNLSYNQIRDISILGDLKSLTCLNLNSNNIRDISILGDLKCLTNLSLNYNSISDISRLGNLKNLTRLDLRENQIRDISIIGELKNLNSLYLGYNEIKDFSTLGGLTSLINLDLSYNQMVDVSILSELKNLNTLDLIGNKINDVSMLKYLTSLSIIDLSVNQITDISVLGHLKNLTKLDLSHNLIWDISILSELKSLTNLDVGNNRITEISILGGLKSLIRLDLRNNRVKDLKPLLHLFRIGQEIDLFGKNKDIFLEGNPLEFPPPEIVKQGNKAIIRYFEQLEKYGEDYLYEAKMLIVGEGGMGKTTLIKKLLDRNAEMPSEEHTTKGIDIYGLHNSIDEKDFKINAWDFGGQEIYHATHQFFLTKRSLYILVDDTRKDNKSTYDAAFKYWLQTVELFGDNSPMLIVQNEKGDRSKDLDFKAIRGKYEFVKEKFATNLLDCRGLDDVEKEIWHQVQKLPHVGQALPKPWIPIREELITLSMKKPYISDEEYLAVCEEHALTVENEAYELSHYLHDLGTFLHFQDDDLLQRIIILQNEWATEAVYRLLDDEEIKENYGRFNQEKAKKTWYESHYRRKIPELLNLMMKFELCYELPEKRNHFLIPQLLPNSKPDHLFTPGANSLQLRYRYDFLPKGLISRFIVRTHQYIEDQENGWKSGVQLKRNNAQAFIEESYNQNLISIWITGENQKEFMTIVSEEMDKLNKTYHGIKVEKLVPCNCASCKNRSEPHFYEYQNLFNRIRKGKKTIECQKEPYNDVDVLGLVTGLYEREYLSNILTEEWPYPYDQTFKESTENFKNVLSEIHDVKEEVITNRQVIINVKEVILQQVDASLKTEVGSLLGKLSEDKLNIVKQLNEHFITTSAENQQTIASLVMDTLEKVEASHKDISGDLAKLLSPDLKVKAKWQLGLPFLFSIEAEKDITKESTYFWEKLTKHLPKGVIY
ncbi:MAG: COR domain-containing protein [Bacteroidota bacterium]